MHIHVVRAFVVSAYMPAAASNMSYFHFDRDASESPCRENDVWIMTTTFQRCKKPSASVCTSVTMSQAEAQIASIRALAPAATTPLDLSIDSKISSPPSQARTPIEFLPDSLPLSQSKSAVYIIQCDKDDKQRHYVGRVTVRPGTSLAIRQAAIWKRFRAHKAKEGAAWTARHGAYAIVAWQLCAGQYDEERWTLEWMDRHGVEHVRGGSMTRVELDDAEKERFVKCQRNEHDLCLICGASKVDHWARDCNLKRVKETCKEEDVAKTLSRPWSWFSFLFPF